MEYKLRDYQQRASDAAYRYFTDKKAKYNAVMVLPTGCHTKGTKILMYDGTLKNVEDICRYDIVIGDDGNPRTVIDTHRGIDKLYKITPIKGDPFTVNGGHILSLYKTNEGGKYPCECSRIDEISVDEYINKSNNYKHLHKLYKPNFVNFRHLEPLIEPYFLGLYLGDGSSVGGSTNITTQRKETVEFLYDLAKKYNIGINIHCRDAFHEVFEVLESEKSDDLFGIFHCFTGDLGQAQRAISLGMKLGIGGVATFKNGKIDQFLNEIDLKHIVLETDSPYLAPVPYRGKRNESSYTLLVAQKLAEIYQLPVEEIARITTENSKQIFGI